MYVATTCMNVDDQGALEVRELRGPLDLLAWVVAEDGCRHGADGQGFCWVSPPRWLWWVGVPHRTWSLGGLVFRFGQWAHGRTVAPRLVWSRPVDRIELEESFGWGQPDLDLDV
jgi:hypothetical protein